MELGRRKDKVLPRLIELLGAPGLHARYGACRALHFQRRRGAPAIPALRRTFASDDLWLRIRSGALLIKMRLVEAQSRPRPRAAGADL